MAITEVSVNASCMPDQALRLVTDVLRAVAGAHTSRGLVRAVAASLSRHLPVRRVELRSAATIVAVRSGDDWTTVESAIDPAATLIAPGLAIVATGPVPHALVGPALAAALEQVIETATRHMSVVQRVAELSRRAHVESRELRAGRQRLEPHGEVVARSETMREAWRVRGWSRCTRPRC